jgi:hypothetical protein
MWLNLGRDDHHFFQIFLWMIVTLATNKNSRKKKKKQWSRELFGKFQKKSSHFKERSFEIAKILGGFGQISRFLLLLYLSCSQIWLNPLVGARHFWSNMRKLEKKRSTRLHPFC